MTELDLNIRGYYETGREIDRFTRDIPSGSLEFERTKEILVRYLTPPRLKILDGGPAREAELLTQLCLTGT